METSGSRAIVLGGGMAGLLAARVLTDHFAQVLLIERDMLTDAAVERKGTPQGHHIHGLLTRGYHIMRQLFPGLEADLRAAGAIFGDVSANVRIYRGGYAPQIETGLEAVFATRATLEAVIRRRVLALPRVQVRSNSVAEGLTTTPDQRQVTGVTITDRQSGQREEITAALVVDATGRGSPVRKWLAALGYATPEESIIDVKVKYATRLYQRTAIKDEIYGAFVAPATYADKRAGVFAAVDGERWIVTLSGRFGEQPPLDDEGFREFARSLPAPDIYDLIRDAESSGSIVPYTCPDSRRFHYERLTRFPQGLVMIGDAVCCFNPVYAQGMTVCAIEATVLDEWLRMAHRREQKPDALLFFQEIAKVINVPWVFGASSDRPPSARRSWLRRYFAQVRVCSQHNRAVNLAFLKVTQLLAPPSSLFHPAIMLRVLASQWLSPRPLPGG